MRLVLFGASAVVSVAFGFLAHNVDESRVLVQRYGYYAIAITFAWALFSWVRIGRSLRSIPSRVTRGESTTAVAVALMLTAIAVFTVPYSYKVLYDEFVLQATAWSMHEIREVGAVVRGYEVDGVFSTLQTYLDKRPFFYAFLIATLHDLTGARESNAFWLNTALMSVCLMLVYVFVRRLASHGAAMAALLALGAYSLMAQNATGSGMELINLAMLLWTMWLAAHYLDRPDDESLSALMLAAVLLAQSRYESSLYVAPVAIVVLEGWRRAGRVVLPAAALLGPVLLIPYALHNTYLSGTPMLWELREGLDARFGLEHLEDNLKHAGAFFFDFSGRTTASWWLGVAGFPALLWTGWRIARASRGWKNTSGVAAAGVVFGGAIIANIALLMFYYWGQLDDPIVSRLSLPISALLAICIAWTAATLPDRLRAGGVAVVIAGAVLAYLTTGLTANATHWRLNLHGRELAWEFDAVDRMPSVSRLIITNKSALHWLYNRVPALQISRARFRVDGVKYHLDQHTFAEVLVFQTYRPTGAEGAFQLDPSDRLPDSYVLEPVVEKRFGARIARISRVKDIRLLESAAKETKDNAS